MSDDLKPCPWCGAAAEFFHGGVRGYARCSGAEANGGPCSIGYRTDDDWNTRPAEDALRARAEAAEAEVERLRAVITKAVDDLPEWSAGVLKHLSPAEVMADEVRMELRRALGGAA